MKKITCIVFVLISIIAHAQKKQKIKGNKDVIEAYNTLGAFSQLEITDGLEVSLMQTGSEGYRLKTDSNLMDVIKLEVVDSILKIYTTYKITSSKKLEIHVTFLSLDKILLKGNSKLIGENMFNMDKLTLDNLENSSFDLDISSNDVSIIMNERSNGKLKLSGKLANMFLNDNTYLKGSLSVSDFNVTLKERADMNIEGHLII